MMLIKDHVIKSYPENDTLHNKSKETVPGYSNIISKGKKVNIFGTKYS